MKPLIRRLPLGSAMTPSCPGAWGCSPTRTGRVVHVFLDLGGYRMLVGARKLELHRIEPAHRSCWYQDLSWVPEEEGGEG